MVYYEWTSQVEKAITAALKAINNAIFPIKVIIKQDGL